MDKLTNKFVLVNLSQSVGIMHNICKVRSSNPITTKKKKLTNEFKQAINELAVGRRKSNKMESLSNFY